MITFLLSDRHACNRCILVSLQVKNDERREKIPNSVSPN